MTTDPLSTRSGRRSAYDIADEAITVLWRMEFGGYKPALRHFAEATVPYPHRFKATKFALIVDKKPVAVCACGKPKAEHDW